MLIFDIHTLPCFTAFVCIMKDLFKRRRILVLSLNPCEYHNIMRKKKQMCGDKYFKTEIPMNISRGVNSYLIFFSFYLLF
jgi:hypothetical protein